MFAYPTGRYRVTEGAVFAQIEAESVWRWGGQDAIVQEWAVIRAYRCTGQGRCIDLTFYITALKEPVLVARRGTNLYGGLNMRLSAIQGQRFVKHTDGMQAWAGAFGVFPGGKQECGLLIFPHERNPHHPPNRVEYPGLNWIQPTFPASGVRHVLQPGKPLVLRYRLMDKTGGRTVESLAVRNAVRRHGVITQIGTQIHASENFRRVVEWVRSGKLGHISIVRTFNVMNQGTEGIGHAPKEPPPADMDWEMWLGPAPKREFNRLLVANAYFHSSFWDYSGGWTMGMGPHIVDLPVWALDLQVPLVTHSTGGRFVLKDDGDVPDTQEVLWQYPNLTMTWTMSMVNSFGFDFGRGSPARRLGIYFHGVNGTLFADYSRHEVVPEGELLKDPTPPPQSIPPSPGHEREWLDCIKSGKQPSCSVEYHYRIDLALTLANVAYKVGRAIRFDPRTEKIVGDREAQRLARPQYRPPWKFPAEYLR